MSLRSSVGRGVRWVGLPAIAATAALGAAALPVQAAPNPAPESLPTGDQYVVALGDSYISGEGAVTSNKGFADATPSGKWTAWEVAARSTTLGPKNDWGYSGLVYGDKGDWANNNSEETIRFCHRSYWGATNSLSDGGTPLKMENLACSGATTNSKMSGANVKPGIDFEPVGETVGQAQQLQDFAKSKRVKVVALSIGGNDAGFADIATACITGWISGWFGTHCNKDKASTDRVTPEAMEVVKNKIKGSIANVVRAMDAAGYARTDWKLLYQQVPMPVAKVPTYSNSGYDRQNKGGCGMYDDDLAWIYNTVFPRLTGAMKAAVAESKTTLGATPVVYVDNTDAFNGHKLCEKGVTDGAFNMKTVNHIATDGSKVNTETTSMYDRGAPAPQNAGWNGQKSEWVTPVIAGDQLGGDADRKQNPLHPNYWGQRALSACNDAALAAGDNKIVTCGQKADKSKDAKGRPAMEIKSAGDIQFLNAPDAPAITSLAAADKALLMSFTAAANASPAVTKYQYAFAADAADADWIDVPAGSGTPAAPEQPAKLVKGPNVGGDTEFVNGSVYQVFLRAVNIVGGGLPSAVAIGTPAPKPAPPTIDKVTPGDYKAMLDITEGDTGNVGVDAYQYRIVAPEEVATDWQDVVGNTSSPLEIDGLPGDMVVKIELAARTIGGTSDAVSFEVTPGPVGTEYVPLDAPARLADKVSLNNDQRTYDVKTLAGTPVPSEATALAINLTMARPTGAGHAEIYPGEVTQPVAHAASVLNWTDGERLANGLTVKIEDGKLTLKSAGQADFYIDVVGYFKPRQVAPPTSAPQAQEVGPSTGTFHALTTPVRSFEQDVAPGSGTVESGVVVDLGKDKDGNAIPDVDMAKVNAVVYNLTATNGSAPGHLRVQPFSSTPGALTPTSALNWYGSGDVVANSSVARLGQDGKIVLYNGSSSPVKAIIDIQGYFVTDGTGLRYFPVDPVRVFDSRVGDGAGKISHPAADIAVNNQIDELGRIYKYDVVPLNTWAIAANVTAVHGTSRDHFKVWPFGDVPNASLVNWPAAGHNRANATMMGVNAADNGARIKIESPSDGADAIVDVFGYFAKPLG